ncbi:MAG: CRISPR-associated helicase Cas3' [Chloroflexi bacterium]|nr:CRISPR-associated helicase Cas3' [Chloroflexota bacterium]
MNGDEWPAQPWPEELETVLLAKSAGKGQGGEPESLACHTWLVLSRLADFIKLRPSLTEQLGQPGLWHCLYWAAFLHDFGKALPGFQGVLRSDVALREHWARNRHELFSLAFLEWINAGLSDDERLWAAAAIISHHRDRAEIVSLYAATEDLDGHDPLEKHLILLPAEHLAGLHRWLVTCGWPWAQALGLAERGVRPVQFTAAPETPFAPGAVARIRRWLDYYDDFVDRLGRRKYAQLAVPLLVLRGMLLNADHSASAHAPDLPRAQFAAQDILDAISTQEKQITWDDLHDHQEDARQKEGSTLLIAPTGSGKTEAALLWAAHQAQGGYRPPRLFYTLPYQASMNAMQARLQGIFGRDKVGLQHGRALLALYRQLMEREDDPKQAARLASWIKNLNDLNYPPVRVFSPYQMLKGMYRLKGYEAQLTDYHNALFIFDEIHAYEVKRLALILKSIEYLRRYYNARFFIMSATFPTIIKSWLREALAIGDRAEIIATPSLFTAFQRHQLHVTEGDLLDHLSLVEKDARAGKSVLVVVNTVKRAQSVYNTLSKSLEADSITVELLHGRFNLRDRLEKEKLVQNCTGSRSDNRRSIVLVATQVVEVSLDIDLETIYTDPAPLEALVQRFGRINRRRAMKDEAGNPMFAPVHVFTLPDDGQKIYDPRLIAGTLVVLQRENGKPVDESAVGAWLDEIYAGEVETAWRDEFTKYAEEFEQGVLGQLRPFQSDPALEDLFYEAFESVDVLPISLENNYCDAREDNFIAAKELLVSIRWNQLGWLKRKGWVRKSEDGKLYIVEAHYDSRSGLDFERHFNDAEEDAVWDWGT